ncbi:hypothetical protein VHEMI07258 [[Torrubiella] hemipterigena]|uniref:Agmatine deiminase n=1 Tax=[Torrubiella] hemipterigena TaxID=1531966 RepID=A0A0A1T2X9_9HYPO|nr:hypothetical protein VHEMI07258 [[Torrubiella] hemipterigena]
MLHKYLFLASLAGADLIRPAEWGPQSGVIMAWPSIETNAYSDDGLNRATTDVSAVADAVSGFQPVTVLVEQDRYDEAQKRFKDAANVTVQPINGYPRLDLWMRDMAPTFVHNTETKKLEGVDYNFNGWGNKYPTGSCNSLAAMYMFNKNISRQASSLVGEGGSFEVDGEGTLLVTESSVVNDNRNKGKDRDTIEKELIRTLGLKKVIWVPGRKGLDITDTHIDGLARFIAPGKVILSRPSTVSAGDPFSEIYEEAREILSNATDASGRKLEITEVPEADLNKIGASDETLDAIKNGKKDYPSLTYVNYLLVNGGVIFPQFGDADADSNALKVMQSLYPDRKVASVTTKELPYLGGGIHCSTQEIPIV